MRIDHHAYQRATQVAGFGLMLQLVIGLALLVFGTLQSDWSFTFASIYVLLGGLVWVSLLILFHQQKLERLEALEHDELAAARGGAESVFERSGETLVAARRLLLMHQWMAPIMSLLLAGGLLTAAWPEWRALKGIENLADRSATLNFNSHWGLAIAITLGIALVSFIFSRFVAGMAKQPAWQNLRGGAAYMVGNALVSLAIAIGNGARYLDNQKIIELVTYALPIFMALVAAEIILNFILNLYRPRIPGEVPRPAFDSKILSLLAAPDSLVRSINEAVNYQFGFDLTSSWGYQLLLRSFLWLVAFGLLVLIALSTMVIVEPQQQAIRLRGGAIVRDAEGRERVYNSGILWKWPWPLERVEVHDVTRVRELAVTPLAIRRDGPDEIILWSEEIRTREKLDPFLMRSALDTTARGSPFQPRGDGATDGESGGAAISATGGETHREVGSESAADAAALQSVGGLALVQAQVKLLYRIRDDGQGLLDFLKFGDGRRRSRSQLDNREQGLKLLALRAVSDVLAQHAAEELLTGGGEALGAELVRQVQQTFDQHRTGVEVVSVVMLGVRPPSLDVAQAAIDVDMARQNRLLRSAEAEAEAATRLTMTVGDAARAGPILAAIDRYEALSAQHGASSPEALAAREEVDRLISQAGGMVAAMLSTASRDRWVSEMQARGRAEKLLGQLPAYRASPRLYRERRVMELFADALRPIRKYVIAIDPNLVALDVEFKELNPLLTPDLTLPIDTSTGANP